MLFAYNRFDKSIKMAHMVELGPLHHLIEAPSIEVAKILAPAQFGWMPDPVEDAMSSHKTLAAPKPEVTNTLADRVAREIEFGDRNHVDCNDGPRRRQKLTSANYVLDRLESLLSKAANKNSIAVSRTDLAEMFAQIDYVVTAMEGDE